MEINIIFAPSTELALQDEQDFRQVSFPEAWLPVVGDEFAMSPSVGQARRFVCIKRLWNFVPSGSSFLEITLQLVPDD